MNEDVTAPEQVSVSAGTHDAAVASAAPEPSKPVVDATENRSQPQPSRRAARLKRDLNRALRVSLTLGRRSTAESADKETTPSKVTLSRPTGRA